MVGVEVLKCQSGSHRPEVIPAYVLILLPERSITTLRSRMTYFANATSFHPTNGTYFQSVDIFEIVRFSNGGSTINLSTTGTYVVAMCFYE